MKIQRCKGTRDLATEDMRRFRFIEDKFKESCLRWGYEEVRTSTIEYLHLFTSTGTLTPNRLRGVYSFLDWDGWSGERVVLRPDGTIPIARLYIESMADREVAKLFYVTDVFNFEGTGKETRERWQCGAELIGAGSVNADVELVVLALDVLNRLGFKGVQLRVSHAGLMRALLEEFGVKHEQQTQAFDRMLDGDMSVINELKSEKPELGRMLAAFLDLRGKSPGFLKNMKLLLSRDCPGVEKPFNNFIDIANGLEAIGCDYQIDITSGRGFEYYTGLIFRLFIGDREVGGGGRYDALIPLMGGKDTPASGFALYLECLMGLIAPAPTASPAKGNILVETGLKNTATTKEVFGLLDILHDSGYPAELYLGGARPENLAWSIEVKSKSPRFFVKKGDSGQAVEAESGAEVLSLLGGGKRSSVRRKR